ncbi:MAG: hypothetical protein PHI76_02900 [Clostridia bacterium]|nr:hypothetical protein [Clostridia bacterium]
MKKIKSLLVLVICLLISAFTYGCGEQGINADFKDNVIQIVVGESYDPYDYLDYEENIKDHITFTSGNNNFFYITSDNQIVASKAGTSILYAYYNTTEIGFCFVEVVDAPIQFNIPVNLLFNTENNKITWSKVIAQVDENLITASSYILEITFNDNTIEHLVIGNSYGPLTETGFYKIRVKTDGGENYLASDYTSIYSFYLMQAPTNLSYNDETSILSWTATNNPEETRYKVYVNDVNIAGTNGIQANEIVLNLQNADNYSIYVEALPLDAQRFSATSEVISIIKLQAPNLSFNNGLLTWDEQNGASGYELVLNSGGELTTYQTNNNSYNFFNVPAGNHSVTVQAIGSEELNSYSGVISEHQFVKLQTAVLEYNVENKIFTVKNNIGKGVEIVFTDIVTNLKTIKDTNDYVFDITEKNTYLVQAQVLASNVTTEINGNFSPYFTLFEDASKELTRIQNLNVLDLYFNQNETNSFIGFENTDASYVYELLLNGELTQTTLNENTFNVGETNAVFTNSGVYEFELLASKEISNQTIFIESSSFLNIEKLTQPLSIGFTDNSEYSKTFVEIKDENLDFNKIKDIYISINDVITNELDPNVDIYNINAKFLPKTSADMINGIRTYYISSEMSSFTLNRLNSVQNISFDYNLMQFEWNNVLNAEIYTICINGEIITQTNLTNYISDLDEAYTITIYAVPESWDSVSNGQTVLMFSRSASFEVNKINEISELHLLLDEVLEKVVVNWTAPQSIPESVTVYYDVLINDISALTELTTENTVAFDMANFAVADTYNIKVMVADNLNQYFLPQNNNSNVDLIKLSSVMQIERNQYKISAKDFDTLKMSGLIINQEHFANSYDISNLNSGQSLELHISYAGIFDVQSKIYCLNSNPSTFTITKLNTPTSLNYENPIFSWETLDSYLSDYFNFTYYIVIGGTKIIYSPTNQLQATIENATEFIFYVYESTITDWLTLNAGETGLLNSNTTFFTVIEENAVSNLKMSFTEDDNIYLSWNYSGLEELLLNSEYRPEFNLEITDENSTVLNLNLFADESYSTENDNYFTILDSSLFTNETDYQVSVVAGSNKTFDSEKQEILITKLNAGNFVSLNGTEATIMNTEINEISLVGSTGVMLSGDVTEATLNTFSIDGISYGNNYVVNVQVKAIVPENILNGHYYLNSEPTTFMFSKIEDITPQLNVENSRITWEQRQGADSYAIQIETFENNFYLINDIFETYLNLNDTTLSNILLQEGIYKIYVKAVVDTKTISANPLLSPELIGFVGSDFSNFTNIEKLGKVQNIIIGTSIDDLMQKDITITWNNVEFATNYDIMMSRTLNTEGSLIGSNIVTSSGETTTFVNTTVFIPSGDYYVWVRATAKGYVNSNISDKIKIVRLEAVIEGDINSVSYLSWNQPNQIASGALDYSYYIQLLDFNNQVVNEFGSTEPLTTNSLNLINNDFINNYSSGNFKINIYVLGNGSSLTEKGITTLTSEFYSLNPYKLISPEININDNILTISSSDENSYPNSIDYYFTIKKDTVTLVLNNLMQGDFELPNEWASGDYEITAYATTNDNNLIKSNTSVLIVKKLEQANNLKLEASNILDLTQKSIKIIWSLVPQAIDYDLYINGQKTVNITPQIEDGICSYTTTEYFQQVGEYEVNIVAKASGFVSSDLSSSAYAVRLNPVESGFSRNNMQIEWTAPVQSYFDYTYYLELLEITAVGNVVQDNSESNLTTLSYSAFAENEWLKNLEGGNFLVSVRVIGNAISDIANSTATFSSEAFNVQILKLYAPEISTLSDHLTISGTNTSELTPSGQIVNEIINYNYSIKTDEQFAKDFQGNDINEIIYDNNNKFYYPENWTSGIYDFYSVAFPNAGVLNVIPSIVGTRNVTRLIAPQNLNFYRAVVDDETQYTSDFAMDEFLSEQLYFNFNEVLNATNYTLSNGNYSLIIQNNTNLVTGFLDELLSKYTNTLRELKVFAVGSGDFINSPSSTISFTKINKINNCYINSGLVNWTNALNTTAYLIKATDENDFLIKFWQSNTTTNSSYLTGILGGLSYGQISLNVKALGNVGTSGVTSGDVVILDSSYMDIDSEFIKLEQPKNFNTSLGFLAVDSVANATNYKAFVYSADNQLILNLILDDFTDKFAETSNRFIGYSEQLYSLDTETLYKIKIQAVSSETNIIHSDFSETINFKILENANGVNDISLEFSPDNMLDNTNLKAYVSNNSYGLIQKSKAGDFSVVCQQEEPYTVREKLAFELSLPADLAGQSIYFSYACLGSSKLVNDGLNNFYYLTSTISQSGNIYVLEVPEIKVENGIIKWEIINGADGYYVYINDNLYNNEVYTLNNLELPAQYGGENNSQIDIRVTAVSNSLSTLYSYSGRYFYDLILNNELTVIQAEVLKLKTINMLNIVDGTFVFDDGVSSLVNYNSNTLTNLLNSYETMQDWQNLYKYLQEVLKTPVLLFSQYLGFSFPDIELCFNNKETNQKYYVTANAEQFIKLTQEQCDDLLDLIDVATFGIYNLIVNLENLVSLYPDNAELFQLLGYYHNLSEFLQSNAIMRILNTNFKQTNGWPNMNVLFEELSNSTAQIPSGNYGLSIRQLGNNCDFLNSNYSLEFNIYIPKAAGDVDIVNKDGDFYLCWNQVDIPAYYNYSPLDLNEDGNGDKYIIYGEDIDKNRFELIRTNGYLSETENRLQINVSTLASEGTLAQNIVKLFIVVAGDNNNTLSGLTSQKLDITLLPQISPQMNNGTLVWDSLVSAHLYEITAVADGYAPLYITTENSYWNGEELLSGVTYNISLRAIGYIYTVGQGPLQTIKYVLSGDFVYFKLSKLTSLNVVVNKYGIFEWSKVPNSQGFIVKIKDSDFIHISNSGENQTKYESTFMGYNNYLFKALGTTGNINSDTTTYYLSSDVNNNGVGILGVILPQVENLRVADGLIKFSPLENINTTEQEQVIKVVGYRITITNGIGELFTTDLIISEFFEDTEGNLCLDLSEYGTENIYNIKVQAYIYYTNTLGTIFENAVVQYDIDEQNYHTLIGEGVSINFEKLVAPKEVKVENGQVTWNSNNGYEYIVDIYTSTGTILSERVYTNSWWTDNAKLLPDMYYFVKVKAYKEGSIYSAYTTYSRDGTSEPTQISKYKIIDIVVNSFSTEEGENIINFNYPSGGIELGFNFKYKTMLESDYSYILINDSNYNDIISYLNGVVSINLTNISPNIELMYYQIQVVPLGLTNNLKSDWSNTFEFSIPEMIENVYYQTDDLEFYWVHVDNKYSYIVRDELLDESDNIVATYIYKIKSASYADENYYKERDIFIDGISQVVGTLSYMPSVVGYKHRVAVAVCLDSSAEYSLVSLYNQCDEISNFDLFNVETDILDYDSVIYQTTNDDTIKQLLTSNAYGSESNPYLINTVTDFNNINFRLDRYNYTYKYSVEFSYIFGDEEYHKYINIEENSINYNFKQTTNLSGITTSIGKFSIVSGGAIIYKNFNNTYKGNNNTLTYNIIATNSNLSLGLFSNLNSNAIINDLNVNATIDFNALQYSTFTFGAIAGQNKGGKIYNCRVISVNIQNLVDDQNNGVKDLTFGGIVGNNESGIIDLCVINEISINLVIANNGDSIYAGGIAGKNTGTISNSGNNASLTVISRKNAYTGGVVGINTGIILQVYNKAVISSSTLSTNSLCYLGGLVGYNHVMGNLKNSYNTGNLTTNNASGPTGSKAYLGGLVGYTLSINITNSYSSMPAITNYGTLITAGTLVGYIKANIPTSFTLFNYYINQSPAGGVESGSITNFAKKLNSDELLQYSNNLNLAAGENIFMLCAPNYPCFVWEA